MPVRPIEQVLEQGHRQRALTRIVFLRHAQAAPAAAGEEDAIRQLTAAGTAQALTRREALGGARFGLAIASPAFRARQTASIVATGSPHGDYRITQAPDLYFNAAEPVGAKIEELFARPGLGYAPVAEYLKHDGGDIVLTHGVRAWGSLYPMIRESGASTVLVVGHAVILPALGIAACGDTPEFVEMLQKAILGECAGFILTLVEGEVTEVSMIA